MISLYDSNAKKWTQTTTHEKPMAVILHLYYQDLFDWYLPYLKNITIQHDVFITICENKNDGFIQKAKAELPNLSLFLVENKGMDVAPFLAILRIIENAGIKYKSILKIHGKKSIAHGQGLGERWRKDLVNSLMFNNTHLQHYQDIVTKDGEVKMVASSNWILKQKIIGYEQNYFKENIIFDEYNFVGGTMFLVNFEIIMNWFSENEIYEKYIDLFPNGYSGDDTIAHQLERVFGCLINLRGCKILGV